MNPNDVQITLTTNLDRVNLILTALGKMPYEAVADTVNYIRGTALQALQEAEQAEMAKASAVKEPLPTITDEG